MKKRSLYAWIWLGAWVVIAALMLYFVAVNPTRSWPPTQWDGRYDALFWGLVALIASAPFMIGFDRGKRRGLISVYYSHPASLMNLDDSAVSGMLSVLSIRAAITLGILVALLNYQDRILAPHPVKRSLVLQSLLDPPLTAILAIVVVVLAASIVTTLVSSLCYEYSIKVDWSSKTKMKLALRQKAHWLGVIGFYCLMWSLAAITALLDAYVCVFVIFGIFFIMWLFYFFRTDILDAPTTTTNQPENVTATSATLSGTVKVGNAMSNAFFEWGTSADYGNRASVDSIALKSNISGLTPKTTYHVRSVAGAGKGEDQSFTTRET
ncbi:MAG TPA: hypothetical protein VGG46_13465 [Terriglobales bacterium]|jgi:hypothetical protein